MDSIQIGNIVRVTRHERGGNRIPDYCRIYSDDGWYMYVGRVVALCPGKRYFRVQPLLRPAGDRVAAPISTRKAYKTKTEKLSNM